MARVHLAVAEGAGRTRKLVVIKQITAAYADDPAFVGMFLDEGRLAARLRHGNVVQTHEMGEHEGRPYLVMEYLDGQPLSRVVKRLARVGGLPLGLHLGVLIEVLRGLDHAHELCDYDGSPLGVVHRDATPGNVFVTYGGGVKVVDFGIAKTRDASVETAAGVVKGKFAYMSPEQARGGKVDRRSDVFAVGVMAWEAVTGRRMWLQMGHEDIILRLVRGAIPQARSVSPAIPDALDAILCKATAPDPGDRYATAAELADALERFVEETGQRRPLADLGELVAHNFSNERAAVRALLQVELGAATPPLPAPALGEVADPPTPLPALVIPSGPEGTLGGPGRRATATSTRVGLLAALVLAAVGLVSTGQLAPAKRAAGLAGPASPAAALAPTAALIRLRVLPTPADASVTVDGRLIASPGAALELPAGGGEREIRIEAPGYAPHVERLLLAHDRDLQVVLDRLAAPAPPAPVEPHAVPHPPVREAAEGRGLGRRLDLRNPYEQ